MRLQALYAIIFNTLLCNMMHCVSSRDNDVTMYNEPIGRGFRGMICTFALWCEAIMHIRRESLLETLMKMRASNCSEITYDLSIFFGTQEVIHH